MHAAALGTTDNMAVTDAYTLALFDPAWHPGVIGIIASRLKERFHRPIIAFARAARTPAAGLLGKVLAHEIGHLLLPAGHSDRGIMRAEPDLRFGSVPAFTREQAALLRREP